MSRRTRWVAVLGAVMILGLLGSPAVRAAERGGAMTAVMQIDTSSIERQMAQIQEEVAKLQDKLASLEKAVTEMNKSVTQALNELNPPDKWEYKLIRTKSEQALNGMGVEGWEAVAAYDEWLVFRRPLKAQPAGQ